MAISKEEERRIGKSNVKVMVERNGVRMCIRLEDLRNYNPEEEPPTDPKEIYVVTRSGERVRYDDLALSGNEKP